MSNFTPPDRPDAHHQLQYWIAMLVPILGMTILTLSLPSLLTQTTEIDDLSAKQAQALRNRLRTISIRVLAHGETIGSGVSIDRQQQMYTVVTNAHVIQSTSGPFQLQTPDGKIYAAALVPPPTGQRRDLSILRFQSLDRTYLTATLCTTSPKIGDRVWSSGFPLVAAAASKESLAVTRTQELTIASGQITQILPTAITGGYRIGSDHDIKKGMSGGPLVDREGRLIGINGVHANPLWEMADTLEDGSTVSSAIQSQINNFSWAIPIEFVKDYTNLPDLPARFGG